MNGLADDFVGTSDLAKECEGFKGYSVALTTPSLKTSLAKVEYYDAEAKKATKTQKLSGAK